MVRLAVTASTARASAMVVTARGSGRWIDSDAWATLPSLLTSSQPSLGTGSVRNKHPGTGLEHMAGTDAGDSPSPEHYIVG